MFSTEFRVNIDVSLRHGPTERWDKHVVQLPVALVPVHSLSYSLFLFAYVSRIFCRLSRCNRGLLLSGRSSLRRYQITYRWCLSEAIICTKDYCLALSSLPSERVQIQLVKKKSLPLRNVSLSLSFSPQRFMFEHRKERIFHFLPIFFHLSHSASFLNKSAFLQPDMKLTRQRKDDIRKRDQKNRRPTNRRSDVLLKRALYTHRQSTVTPLT